MIPLYGRFNLFSKAFINNKRFTFLWLCSFSSFLTLPTYIFAEQWYILKYLDANKYLGLIMMLTMLPRIILMFIGRLKNYT